DRATVLVIKNIPEDTNISDWRKLIKSIENKVNIAEKASVAWNKIDRAEKTISQIQKITSEFRSIASGIPIKERWMEGMGYDFTKSVTNLGNNCTQANVTIARESLYSASIIKFIDMWKNARDYETAIGENTCNAENIPSEQSRISEWWNEAPSVIVVRKTDYSILPVNEDELWMHMEACETRDANWKSYCDGTLPTIEKRRDEEFRWANGALRDALDIIPKSHPDKSKIEQIVKPLINGDEVVWHTAELQTVFSPFSPDRIKGQIDAIDAQLEELSFKVAKDEWLNYLGDDIETQTALESLLIHYRKNYGRIHDSFHESFEKVLPSAPIWITTAQSSQSIPMEPDIFDLLVIDEATQCTLTNILPMIYRAKRIAVIGDPEQLPAIGTIGHVAEMSLAAKFGIIDWLDFLGHAENDVFKAAVHCLPRRRADIISLVEHYRSHPQIIGFVNQHVYQKRLRLRKGSDQSKTTTFGGGMHTRQVNGFCTRGPRGRSWVNIPEVDEVCKLVSELRDCADLSPFHASSVKPLKLFLAAVFE
ncbi:MAG: hypothetical protein KAH86_07145, partial [Methanosarcinales archaeon]|nr:hypothetical protein [Methanosarcinales archaeon]